MPAMSVSPLPVASLNQPVATVLNSAGPEKQTVSNQLNSTLKSELISAATSNRLQALANVLQTLSAADLATDQNLSLRDFVTKYTTLPTDAAAKQAAQAAIATLSTTTTVGALLGLTSTVSGNPVLSGIVAQTNLVSLLGTSPALASTQLQTDFIEKYSAFQGSMQDFWTQLTQDPEFKASVPELQFTMQLGVLTLNNPQLTAALRTAYKPTWIRALTTLDAASLAQLITTQKIPVPAGISGSTPAEQLTNYVNGIIGLLESAFPTDYVAKQLASSSDTTLQSVAKVLANAPDIDLGSTNLNTYLQQNSAAAFKDIPAGQVTTVTAGLLSTQRVFRINQEPATVAALVSAGMDSAAKITALTQSNFVNQFSSALGGDTQAQAVYSSANLINAQTLNLYTTVHSGLNGVNPVAIAGPSAKLVEVLQNQVPNWQQLFGSTSYCTCNECGSVYGPAAYFVDLLQFLGNSKKNIAGFSPLDVLIGGTSGNGTVSGRRPDLPYIKLDCQNADTPLPYIDLVNEILESYIVLGGKLDSTTAHNTPADAGAPDLLVNPEYTLDAAYATLAQANYPLTLPYDRLLDVARSYLAFLGGDRRQLIELFGTQPSPFDTEAALAAETLGLTQTEFKLIANWDFQAGASTAPPALNTLYLGNIQATTPWETWISSVPNFLNQTGLAFTELVDLLKTQFVNPGQAITLSGAEGCDLSQTTITTLDDPTLTRILPFLRLAKKLGCSMSDLDKALRVFAPNGINRSCLLALADLVRLQTQTNLTLPQLLSLWSGIDTDGRDSLYVTLFQNRTVLKPVDPALQISYRAALDAMPATALPPSVPATQLSYDAANHQMVFVGRMTEDQRADLLTWASGSANVMLAVENLYQMRWAPGTDVTPGSTLTDTTPSILAALRISANDLAAIRTATGLLDTATKTPLTLGNLTQLYRYTALAQALGIAIPDLIALIPLTGLNPFQLATTDPVTAIATGFVEAAQAVTASAFSVPQLSYIYRAIANPAAGVGPLEANVDLLAITLQTGLVKVATANAYVPDPTGKLLRQKLGGVIGGSQLSSCMDLIAGTAIYAAGLAALPSGIVFPSTVSDLVSYDDPNQNLTFSGAMTDSQNAILMGLSTDASYQDAVSALYQQPRAIISSYLAFLDPVQALASLINSPLPNVGDRFDYVLRELLSFLTDTQSRALVQQSLGQALALDSATVGLLVSGDPDLSTTALLSSGRDASQSALADFLDLQNGGLLATYFTDSNLATAGATRIDLQAGASAVSNPGGARWRGKVQPQFSEAYTFYVTANDGVRLWVNDQLLIDQWANQPVSTRNSGPVNLNAEQLYDIRLDYYNASTSATLVLGWSSKSTSNNVNVEIPANVLFPANTFLSLSRLYPIGLLLTTFGIKAPEVAYLSSHSANFVGIDPSNSANTVKFDLSTLPVDRSNPAAVDQAAPAFFNQWSQLSDLLALRNSLPPGNVSLFDVFRAASNSVNPAQLGGGTVSAVLAATGWDAGQFATLSGSATVDSAIVGFGLTDADFVNATGRQAAGLVRLKKCLDFSAVVGVPALQSFLWANRAPDSPQADDIKSTVKAKYDDATWISVGQGLNNKIRDNSKSALLAYVLNMPAILQLGISNTDKLYEYFLIDVEMSSCMQTSRIVQATAAIQLFVQRCLLNLEDSNTNTACNVGPDAIDAPQWEWRKNYRVWEANREVFLYPENWIDPTLRDNRTPFFEELQADLQQGEMTGDFAETAFRNYLTKLLEVSRLEICGCFAENDTDPSSHLTHNVLHVFGRTYAQPHVYYYRTLDRITNVWSAWESVDADIQGDHLIPVMWNRRLYLFWPIFKEQTTPNSGSATGSSSTPLPLKSLEIQFAWSEYQNGAWSKKQVAAHSLTPNGFGAYTFDFDPSVLTFSVQVNGPALTIFVYQSSGEDLSNAGYVTFSGCSSIPMVGVMSGTAAYTIPPRTAFDYMDLDDIPFSVNLGFALSTLAATGTETNAQGLVEIIYTSSPVQVLNTAFPPFSLLFAEPFWPNVQMNVAPPFFYTDSMQTYLVTQQSSGFESVLTSPVNAIVPYTAQQLNPAADGVLTSPALPIFEAAAVPSTTTAAGVAAVTASTGGAGTLSAGTTTPVAAAPITNVTTTVAGALSAGTAITATTPLPITTAPTAVLGDWDSLPIVTRTQLTFFTHRHAHVCDFLKALNWQGVGGLLTLDNQKLDDQDMGTASVFYQTYGPTAIVNPAYPSQLVDFSLSGAYSIYNWELFFHIPLLIATQLSQNQQFEDAETWFRYIFNPTSNSPDSVPSRYWNVLPFYQNTDIDRIEDLITALSSPGPDQTAYMQQIAAWVQTPFDPDLIARMRIVAYQKAVVMKYIDHQLAWGDSLYRQFTRESVNEATLHYVLCQDILGDKPVMIPPQGVIADQTYASLSSSLDGFSDALVALENLFPFSTTSSTNSDGSGSSTASGIAMVPYFCIPPNDTLLGYWDTVSQRLFQIRHCMNIAGQVQQLPLFAPPINPGVLIQALEMGMDLTSALSDISAATPFYRFQYMLPKALELCAEVRSLGSSLLASLEKGDAEGLSMLRATQETALMKAIRNVKQQQLNESNSNVDALNDTLAVTTNRQQYYQGLIKQGLISQENSQISNINLAMYFQLLGQASAALAVGTAPLPDATAGAAGGMSSPVTLLSFGGTKLAAAANFATDVFQALGTYNSTQATLSGLQAGWARRTEEWNFQQQAATLEITQINDQIAAATARVAAAQADLDNQDIQISNASDVEHFLRTKFTNQALYSWMTGQVSSVYFQCYQMAYEMAKRAEACFIFERMPDLSNYTAFIQYGYWDSLKQGLLSGERLYQDLKRLEIAYMDQDQRDYEITKSVSLLLLDPMALINLKETGQCTVQFPEALFDMDYPGHFLRRIKMLSLIIPCVVGPYTSLNCTLTLASSKIRVSNVAADAKDYVKDSHFLTNFSAAESIATSTGQNDSGLFSVNFNDERYLPFEGAGVISTWQLSMPQDTNAFDFETITDVIFDLRYTARDGGASLRSVARAAAVLPPGSTPGASVAGQTALPQQQTATRMFSLRHEFPSAWNLFLHPPDSVPDQTMTINLTQDRFPFQYRGKKIQIYQVDVFLKFRDIYDPVKYTANGTPQGDYAAKGAAGALTLNLTPPSSAARTLQLASNGAVLGGVPYGSVPQPPPVVPPAPPALGALGAWALVAKGTDIANIAVTLQAQLTTGSATNNRLATETIEDIYLIAYFATN